MRPSSRLQRLAHRVERLVVDRDAAVAVLAVALALWFYFKPSEPAVRIQDLGALVEIPDGRFDYQGQPASLPVRDAVVVVPPLNAVIFPAWKMSARAADSGHSFQSVRCMWMV